jgi:hypothetical protein
LIASLQIAPAVAAAKDFTIPATYIMTRCLSATEFDCIESVGIVSDSKVYEAAKPIADSVSPKTSVRDGNTIYSGFSRWGVGDLNIYITGTLDSPVSKGCNQTCSALRFNVNVTNPLETKVRFVFRTSWLRPMNVQMKALESNYSFQKIEGGARWMLEGKGMPISDYNANSARERQAKKDSGANADLETIFFDFYIHHAGTTVKDSFWDPRCSDVGFSVQSHNTNETGDPTWDPVSESLIFSIFAPHRKADGNLYTGYFKYWASHAFLDCKFPTNNLTSAPRLSIQILYEDGEQSVMTSDVVNKDGKLYFFAAGFHFSSPKIVVKAAANSAPDEIAPTAEPSPTPSPTAKPVVGAAKPLKITCVKGKIIKKVSAMKTKCPTGYKKKR